MKSIYSFFLRSIAVSVTSITTTSRFPKPLKNAFFPVLPNFPVFIKVDSMLVTILQIVDEDTPPFPYENRFDILANIPRPILSCSLRVKALRPPR